MVFAILCGCPHGKAPNLLRLVLGTPYIIIVAWRDDRLVHVEPLFEMFGKWDDFLTSGLSEEEVEKVRCHERTGRPPGANSFLAQIENALGRILHKQKPGLKRSQKEKKHLPN